MSERLRKCPFCGDFADLNCDRGALGEWWFVSCRNTDNCSAQTQGDFDKEFAIKYWNRRT